MKKQKGVMEEFPRTAAFIVGLFILLLILFLLMTDALKPVEDVASKGGILNILSKIFGGGG